MRGAQTVSSLVTILPMAFVMIAGPQIISAIFLATSESWRRDSIAFLSGAALSITLFVSVAYFAASAINDSDSSTTSGGESTIDIVILVLLLFLMLHVFRTRKTTEPPKWMGKLQTASPGFSFKLGALLLGVFPTDIITSVTVGSHLAREGNPWVDAIPFILLTLLLLGLPALTLLVLGERGKAFLPKARDWMNTNSWIVSEIVIVLFVAITVNSIVS